MKTALQVSQQQQLEQRHREWLGGWSNRIADLTLRSAAIRKEQALLERAIVDESARMTMQLVRLGFTLPDAEARVEQLLEEAFQRAPQ